MAEKKILTGNEAIARGFYEAGGRLASSYPGSPTVEMMEAVKKYEDKDLYAEFSINEKVALEVGIGASFYGARTMVTMKHVGVNVAADPLMTFTETPTNGGFILVSGDDPGMASSQNEQDNRIFAKFANMGVLYPGSSQEAKDYMKVGFEISEKFEMPMLMDITSRVCHSRGVVEISERVDKIPTKFEIDQSKYVMIPPHTFARQYAMRDRIQALSEYAYDCPVNVLEEVEGSKTVVITSGLMYHNLKELGLPISVYKAGLVYPLSEKRMKELDAKYENIIIIEEMMPFIQNELKLMGIESKGKEFFSFTGELQIEDIKNGLIKAGVIEGEEVDTKTPQIISRPPMFCAGCPHRPVFDVLKKLKVTIMGDIGCYSMASGMAFEASHSIISMGATVGITKGMNKVMRRSGDDAPIVSVIGDGTFFHSGMTGFANLLHQMDEDDNMTFIILDNRTTGMTGGQNNAGSGSFNKDADMNISIKAILDTMGLPDVVEVDQFEYKNLKEIIKSATERKGISIIITKRPCALRYKIKERHFYVDPTICINCRSCVKTNCPPIRMKKYEGIEKLKSSIDPDMCVGCSVCAQVCPVNAIKRSED